MAYEIFFFTQRDDHFFETIAAISRLEVADIVERACRDGWEIPLRFLGYACPRALQEPRMEEHISALQKTAHPASKPVLPITGW